MTPHIDGSVDARSGNRALMASILDAGVPANAVARGYLVDWDYQQHGFSFLTSEEQAIAFMESLQQMGCSKYVTAKSHFDHFTRPGGLIDILESKPSRLDLAVHALSIARRTHCACHETGSYKLTARTSL